jgi:hypothetical protein
MFLERYEYKKGYQSNQFYFYSDGPKGRIRKAVAYMFLGKQDGVSYYNVGFGDFDSASRMIRDMTVSDNKDRDKVLSTVAATAIEFTRNKNCRLIVAGSTPSRTRLYQIKIAIHFDAISELFDIQGRTETGWEKFKKDKDYQRFMFQRFH